MNVLGELEHRTVSTTKTMTVGKVDASDSLMIDPEADLMKVKVSVCVRLTLRAGSYAHLLKLQTSIYAHKYKVFTHQVKASI